MGLKKGHPVLCYSVDKMVSVPTVRRCKTKLLMYKQQNYQKETYCNYLFSLLDWDCCHCTCQSSELELSSVLSADRTQSVRNGSHPGMQSINLSVECPALE